MKLGTVQSQHPVGRIDAVPVGIVGRLILTIVLMSEGTVKLAGAAADC